MSLVFEKLAQSLGAGAHWMLGIAGDFFRLSACEWPVTVRLYQGGREVGVMAGMQAGDFVRDVHFDQVRVENGGTAQTVTVQIAGGGVGSDRVIGEVSVIDGGKARTVGGVAFLGAANQTAVVGAYSCAQIKNPAGSGKRVNLLQIDATITGAAGLVGIGARGSDLASLSGFGISKLMGGAASVIEIRKEAIATLPAVGMIVGGTASGVAFQRKLAEPIVINPGGEVAVWSSVLNMRLDAAFEWYEEAAT